MIKVLVGLGSNIDREQNINRALDALDQRYEELSLSEVYESESVGFNGDSFLNLVASFLTSDALSSVQSFLKALEAQSGRTGKESKWSGRTLDIDILCYGDEVGEREGIILPRAEIVENAYVLRPLAELLPNEVLPGSEISYAELWERYDKPQKLWPVKFSRHRNRVSDRQL